MTLRIADCGLRFALWTTWRSGIAESPNPQSNPQANPQSAIRDPQ